MIPITVGGKLPRKKSRKYRKTYEGTSIIKYINALKGFTNRALKGFTNRAMKKFTNRPNGFTNRPLKGFTTRDLIGFTMRPLALISGTKDLTPKSAGSK